MASCICHVFCVTKRLRLERLVRPPHPELAPDLATAQHLRRTVQQVWPNDLSHALAVTKYETCNSSDKNSHYTLTEAEILKGSMLKPSPRVRDANAANERDATDGLELGNNNAGNEA